MEHMSLSDMEKCISAAFDRWLDQKVGDFQIDVGGKSVTITIRKVDDRFNCGVPGYMMANSYINDLANWVPNNIKLGQNAGSLSPCRDQAVNVWLKGGVAVMFNFHVNLSHPC